MGSRRRARSASLAFGSRGGVHELQLTVWSRIGNWRLGRLHARREWLKRLFRSRWRLECERLRRRERRRLERCSRFWDRRGRLRGRHRRRERHNAIFDYATVATGGSVTVRAFEVSAP